MTNNDSTPHKDDAAEVSQAASGHTRFSIARVAGGVGGVIALSGCALVLFIIALVLQFFLSLFGTTLDFLGIWPSLVKAFERMS